MLGGVRLPKLCKSWMCLRTCPQFCTITCFSAAVNTWHRAAAPAGLWCSITTMTLELLQYIGRGLPGAQSARVLCSLFKEVKEILKLRGGSSRAQAIVAHLWNSSCSSDFFSDSSGDHEALDRSPLAAVDIKAWPSLSPESQTELEYKLLQAPAQAAYYDPPANPLLALRKIEIRIVSIACLVPSAISIVVSDDAGTLSVGCRPHPLKRLNSQAASAP